MDFNYFLNPIQNHYLDFKGRATRKEYWMYVLWYFIIGVLGVIVGHFIHFDFFGTLFFLGVILPTLAIQVRRLHDVGKSGWWIFIGMIPIIGGLWLLFLLVQPSVNPPPAIGDTFD
jgi:uncharacterized membrane protein YhaH (DUF805 family)